MNSIASTSVLRRNPNLVSSCINDEVVIFDEDQGFYFSMNQVGTQIWNFLDQEKSLRDLSEDLLRVYDISESSYERDLQGFLNQLLEKKIIQVETR